MDKKIKTWPVHFPTKENTNMEKVLFDWPMVLQYESEVSVDFQKVIGHEIFQPGVFLTNQKPHAFVSVR